MAWRGPHWPLAWGALVFGHAWLTLATPLHLVPLAGLDDLLFIRHAGALLSGQWLGPYDQRILAKGPGYGMFLALSWAIGLPVLLAQGLLYAAAAAALVRGLRPWLPGEAAALLLFALLLFNPALFGEAQLRTMREGLYVPLTLLILAAMVWSLRWRAAALPRRLALAAGFGLLLGLYWITREEGPWIFPTLAAALGVLLALDLAGEARWRAATRTLGLAGLTLVTALGAVGLVQAMNFWRYGVAVSVEFREPAFLSAYGALTRIRHANPVPYVVFPRDVREAAFRESAAARELRPHLEGPAAQLLIEAGCELERVTPCDGEMRGSHFMWLLREAAGAAGHHANGRSARGFYARLAAEIDAACAEGRLACGPPRRTMLPPFDPSRIPVAVAAFGEALAILATFRGVAPPADALSCRVDDCGQSLAVSLPLEAARSDLFTLHRSWLDGARFQRRSEPGGREHPFQMRAALARAATAALAAGYGAALPALLGLAGAAFAAGLWLAWRRRRAEPLLAIAALALILALSRAALIAWMDATAMDGLNTLYLSPAWPPLLLFAALTPLALWRLARPPALTPPREAAAA